MNSSTPSSTDNNNFKGWRGIKRAFATPSALTMLFLGFGSGLPFLLVGVTLSTWLRDTGVALSVIGLISYASFFYVLKFSWAPLIDRYPLPFLGRRKGWLALSQLLLISALAGMAVIGPESLWLFVLLAGLAAFAGATQDIVVDAYRIEVAPVEAQAALAATYILGYRFGLIISGAIALYLAELTGWTIAYLIMAACILLPLVAGLLSKEPAAQKLIVREIHLRDAFIKPFQEFFSRNGVLLALALLAFVGLFKLPDQMIGVLAGPFYLDSGFTKADIATVSKVYGVWIGIAGAFLGGVCVAAFNIKPMLVIAAIAVAISNLVYLLMAIHPSEQWAFFATISADNLSQGFAGVVLVAFMSSLTNRNFTATQYALLVSLAHLPGKFIGGLSGYIVEASSYSTFFILSTISVVPTLLLLMWIWSRIQGSTQHSNTAQ
ncbi:AmpG family muropeptide MFS transporter [Cellvibrio sp. OA-2007]|uniref:AmpG family muropeptide MFS transporter n=1 Tax=Cellvibrio sp. OA-2007 TaxID=529823 RepID=UPI0007802C40|nr:MFS transporter [Cellvibrio sp. OA-2007]